MHHSTIWSVLNSENLKTCFFFFFFPSSMHCLCVNGLYWILALSYSKLVQLSPSSLMKKNAPLIQSQTNTFTTSKLYICPRHQAGLVFPQSTQPFAAVQLPLSLRPPCRTAALPSRTISLLAPCPQVSLPWLWARV